MNLLYIIKETLLMMGFTFIVGMTLAYAIKMMALLFPALSGGGATVRIGRDRVRWRAYRMQVARIYRSLLEADEVTMRHISRGKDRKSDSIAAMNRLAEYHFGSTPAPSRTSLLK